MTKTKRLTEKEKQKLMISLAAKNIYWDDKDHKIAQILGDGNILVEEMNTDDIKYLIKELDRRLAQLWQKVSFEKENQLVNYSPIKGELKRKSNVKVIVDDC